MKGSQTEWIDRYLRGELSPTEQATFEARCREDAAFAEEVRRQVEAEYTVRRTAREARAAELNALFDSLPIPPTARSRNLRLWGGIALAVAAALALLLLLWPGQKAAPSPQELYALQQTTHSPQAYRGSDTLVSATWQTAMRAFGARQYPQAITQLEGLVQDSAFRLYSTAHYYLGLSYSLLDDQQRKAGPPLDTVLTGQACAAFRQVSPESSLYQRALWQLALTQLKAGTIPEARKALEAVKEYPGHVNAQAAQELLEALRSGGKK